MDKIKGDVQRMVKRRKDSGFTLIELMIVIAVIGILAVVLVPKVGGVKTAAKNAGVDVNVRTVEAYAESQITKWGNKTADQTTVEDEITNAMTNGNNKLVNPINSAYPAFISYASSPVAGAVYVEITGTSANYTVTVNGLDANKAVSNKAVVNP